MGPKINNNSTTHTINATAAKINVPAIESTIGTPQHSSYAARNIAMIGCSIAALYIFTWRSGGVSHYTKRQMVASKRLTPRGASNLSHVRKFIHKAEKDRIVMLFY
ncbi:hypothetical protein BDW59DRAFT_143680 [Aspergillus cavernicola]|uniref:Uncharacterized protein n=1 Tax=Aspergillus cavernicola TaxID=176166 RepID=A0ABR4IJU2_9EURO